MPMVGDGFVPTRHSRSASPEAPFHSKRAQVEEVEDEDDPGLGRFPEHYPGNAAETFGKGQTMFESTKE